MRALLVALLLVATAAPAAARDCSLTTLAGRLNRAEPRVDYDHDAAAIRAIISVGVDADVCRREGKRPAWRYEALAAQADGDLASLGNVLWYRALEANLVLLRANAEAPADLRENARRMLATLPRL